LSSSTPYLPPSLQGFTAALRDEVCQRTTHVIHAAATVKFTCSLSEAFFVNVRGTQHMLSLGFKNLKVFSYISTAYVSCWMPTGTRVPEAVTRGSGGADKYSLRHLFAQSPEWLDRQATHHYFMP